MARNDIDWERIELDYRAGLKTLREMAGEHSISEGSIRKRATRDGWTRDVSAKVQARANELVRKAEVRAEVRKECANTERVLIEASAQAIAEVKLSHRTDVTRFRSLLTNLLAELEHQTDDLSLYEQLGDLMAKPNERGEDKLNDLYRKVIGLPQRTKVIVDLANTLKTLIGLERESYNIDNERLGEEEKPQEATPVSIVINVKDASIEPSVA